MTLALISFQAAAAAVANGSVHRAEASAGILVEVSGTFVGTITFEASMTHVTPTWSAVPGVNVVNGDRATTVTAPGLFYVPLAGLDSLRCRISAFTSGTITAKGRRTDMPVALQDVDVTTGDIALGAVELKDATTDTRAKVAAGTAIVEADIAVATKDFGTGLTTDADTALTVIGRLKKILATLTDGTAKAIARGGAKGSTTAADVTSKAIDANTQSLHVSQAEALPAGNANIGDVDVVTLPALVTGSATIGAVTGPTADNAANPTLKLGVLSGVALAAAPTRTEGNVNPLRLNLAGDAAVTLDGEAVVLGAGTAEIGKLAAGVANIGDVDVLTLPALVAGTANIGDVDVLTLPALVAGTANIGDVDVLTLPALVAGTANIGDVDIISELDVFDVTLTLDTAIYAADEVLSDTTTITNAVRAVGKTARLRSIALLDEDDQGVALDFVFFTTNVSLGAKNAAPTITDADMRNALGVIKIATGDYIDVGASRLATRENLDLLLKAAPASRDVFFGTITRGGAPTYTVNGVRVRLGLTWD